MANLNRTFWLCRYGFFKSFQVKNDKNGTIIEFYHIIKPVHHQLSCKEKKAIG